MQGEADRQGQAAAPRGFPVLGEELPWCSHLPCRRPSVFLAAPVGPGQEAWPILQESQNVLPGHLSRSFQLWDLPPTPQGFRASRGAESRGPSAMVQGQSQAVQGVAWGNGGAPQHGPSPHRGRCPSRHGAHVTNIQTPHPASAHTHFQNTAEPTISSQSLAEDEEAHRRAAEPMAAGLAIRGTAGGSPGSCPRPGQETSLQSLRYHPQGSQSVPQHPPPELKKKY